MLLSVCTLVTRSQISGRQWMYGCNSQSPCLSTRLYDLLLGACSVFPADIAHPHIVTVHTAQVAVTKLEEQKVAPPSCCKQVSFYKHMFNGYKQREKIYEENIYEAKLCY
ncbi:hypothetical protein ILYODFUR_033203 [Ilyodon furcidens]|uniref:Uncharacterized protein n=1 Tax=Ilyodon furcidens TaxID=33524 RepID=A0ABV0TZX6_9TELE